MAVDIRVCVRRWSDAMCRIHWRQDERTEFIRRSPTCYGRYRTVAVRCDDHGGRDDDRSRSNHNSRFDHDRTRNSDCRGE